jgi:hypothetical protein
MGITLATSITDEYTIEYQTNASANDYLLKQYTTGNLTIDLTKYIIAATAEYTQVGNHTVAIPQWCSSIACILIGGGGGGGSSGGSSLSTRGGGGGGAGGSLATRAFTVSASASINITVGAGGASPAGNGVSGGNSSLTVQTITYTAYGGIGGEQGVAGGSSGLGGAGGGISYNVGPVPFNSVNGNNGSNGSTNGGNGGGRTKLDIPTTGTKYCENFIATGGTSGLGSGYGAGGKGGGFNGVSTTSSANGTAGYAKVYFYI